MRCRSESIRIKIDEEESETDCFNRRKKLVERKSELRRRYHRKHKLAKLRDKLASAKDGREKETILKKIHALSPTWTPKDNAQAK